MNAVLQTPEPAVAAQKHTRRIVGFMGASLGTGNRGVSALAASVIKLLKDANPGVEISMLIGNRSDAPFELTGALGTCEIPVINYRLSLRSFSRSHLLWIFFTSILYKAVVADFLRRRIAKWSPWVQFLHTAEHVCDIRGGDSFSDIYGTRSYIIGTIPILSVILVRGKITLLPQTYGPFNSWPAKMTAKYILRHANTILSRDLEGLQMVEKLIGKTDRSRFCPDVAFSLEKRDPQNVIFEPKSPPLGELTIGINVNGLMFRGGYTRNNMFGLRLNYSEFLLQLTNKLLSETNAVVLLVPHTFAPADNVESDPAACRELRSRLPAEARDRVFLLEGEHDQSELKAIIGRCDFFVGSRMHACIAALSQEIPTVGVAYSKKFVGVFQTVGLESSVLDGRLLGGTEAVQATFKLLGEREKTRRILARTVPAVKKMLSQSFSNILEGERAPASMAEELTD